MVQTCVVHLIRSSLRYASRRDAAEIARDLKPVYTAVSEEQARDRLTEFGEKWDTKYPPITGIWQRAWNEFIPFLSLPPAIRQVVYTTNAIESLNARYRRAAQACGHFPNETAALKPRHPRPGPHRPRPAALVQPLESRPQRVRRPLRRPPCRQPGIGHTAQHKTHRPNRRTTPNSWLFQDFRRC
ncbi:transposase [Streptomyces sp. NPDC057445]|uniref:transposase n=1 Tax=Streptomyces sp. NPDC057445 TaxID=3346136 RepID=UPI0036949E65